RRSGTTRSRSSCSARTRAPTSSGPRWWTSRPVARHCLRSRAASIGSPAPWSPRPCGQAPGTVSCCAATGRAGPPWTSRATTPRSTERRRLRPSSLPVSRSSTARVLAVRAPERGCSAGRMSEEHPADPGAAPPLCSLPSLLGEVLAQTCGLIAPRQCPCGAEGTRLCSECAALLAEPLRRVVDGCDALQLLSPARTPARGVGGVLLPAGVDHAPLLPVLALGEYGGDPQRLVLAWKNGGMLHLVRPLAAALAPAVAMLVGA